MGIQAIHESIVLHRQGLATLKEPKCFVVESLPAGSGEDWLCWRSLNRLRTGVGRAKTVMRKWGYLDDAQSVDCDCREPQTMAHLLSCRLLDEACTADDLAMRPQVGEHCVKDTTEEDHRNVVNMQDLGRWVFRLFTKASCSTDKAWLH